MVKAKVLIAMSGGVDSSVAAWLAQKQGYLCIGGTMQLFAGADEGGDARSVADRLGMAHSVFDFSKEFRRDVMDAFADSYERGLTPNPCIVCNRRLKFGVLLQQALAMGCEKTVTGHYAQIRQDPATGRHLLYKAVDLPKDQTYFLYGLNQEQLAHILFPLGALTKEQVRRIAEEQGFFNARKRDSQDICFIPDGDYPAFLRRHTGKDYPRGDYLDLSGRVIGQHQGAVCYTIGQRKGLGIALGAPAYVCAKNMAQNTVTLGPNDALFRRELRANDWNWIPFPAPDEPIRAKAKARSRMTEQPVTVYPEENGIYRVVFDEPQRAITPGQAVVLYDDELVIGGGTIL